MFGAGGRLREMKEDEGKERREGRKLMVTKMLEEAYPSRISKAEEGGRRRIGGREEESAVSHRHHSQRFFSGILSVPAMPQFLDRSRSFKRRKNSNSSTSSTTNTTTTITTTTTTTTAKNSRGRSSAINPHTFSFLPRPSIFMSLISRAFHIDSVFL
ncbi:hypothetical protein E2C01_043872 [Portunus trituberculatus]|uniref:Uncharacterized protein n=1 Tax=Portunus trituberculatus TaxID=210409 RepID=A0A5B7FQK0_PORTR|nr:hypothetical protein [Portunus trituberculatus]